jgi:ferredoxin
VNAPRMERWLQTGSGGAMVAARTETASTMATATLMETYRAYLSHGSACQACKATETHCATAAILHDAWRAAQNTGRPQTTDLVQPRPRPLTAAP